MNFISFKDGNRIVLVPEAQAVVIYDLDRCLVEVELRNRSFTIKDCNVIYGRYAECLSGWEALGDFELEKDK